MALQLRRCEGSVGIEREANDQAPEIKTKQKKHLSEVIGGCAASRNQPSPSICISQEQYSCVSMGVQKEAMQLFAYKYTFYGV